MKVPPLRSAADGGQSDSPEAKGPNEKVRPFNNLAGLAARQLMNMDKLAANDIDVKMGDPKMGRVYEFPPARSLGGTAVAENLQERNANVYTVPQRLGLTAVEDAAA